MTKAQIFRYYGGATATAKAFGLTRAAVHAWPDKLPEKLVDRIVGRILRADGFFLLSQAFPRYARTRR